MANTIKISQFNIAMALRDEKYDYSKFDNRFPRIIELIKQSNADVICMQEAVRDIDGKFTKSCILGVMKEMGYDHHYAYYNESKLSFGAVVFYRRDKFHMQNSEIIQLSPKADINNRKIALGVELKVVGEDQTFWCYSTHFGMTKEERWESCKKLAKVDNACIIAGDFNFFEDDEGDQQREFMEKTFTDLAYPLEGVKGTFVGFKHDRYGPSDEQLKKKELSRLDHMFAKGVKKQKAYVEGDLDDIPGQTYPSDHLMISAEITL